MQKKTFTKWVNSHLARVGCHIGDLYADLRDGFVLTRLLEVLSGEQLVRGRGGAGRGGPGSLAGLGLGLAKGCVERPGRCRLVRGLCARAAGLWPRGGAGL